MTDEQVLLANLPADDIPIMDLFTYVPLEARMSQGVQNMKDFILKQRDEVTRIAASTTTSEKTRPPEARITEMTNSGTCKMSFTSKLDVPEGETEAL